MYSLSIHPWRSISVCTPKEGSIGSQLFHYSTFSKAVDAMLSKAEMMTDRFRHEFQLRYSSDDMGQCCALEIDGYVYQVSCQQVDW